MKRWPLWVLGGAACAALAACGTSAHSPHPAGSAAAHAGAGAVSARGAADPSRASLSSMVSAVSAASSDRPIDLKFELLARPTLGQPLHIDLALIVAPGTHLQRLDTSLAGSSGLKVQSSSSFGVDTPMPGAVVRRQVTVLPQRAGVLRLDATVLFVRAGSSVARTFTIPLIVARDAS